MSRTGTPAPTDQEVQARPGWGHRLIGYVVSGGATSLLMALMYLHSVDFFLVADKRNQYLPVARDIGRRIVAGEWLPIIDPNLGPAGNYSLDIQYGLYDPVSLVVAVGLSHIGSIQVASLVWSMAFGSLFAVGTTALAIRLRMPVPWAAAAGLAAATAGWVFFKLGTTWTPGLVSIAWLPWVWWAWLGLRSRLRVRDCLGIAVFSFLVIAGGWPATWLAFGALIVGLVVETWSGRASTTPTRDVLEPIALRFGAALAGAVSAGLCVIPLLHAYPYTTRSQSIQNTNFLTGNLADMLSFAAPQLHGDIRSFGGTSSIDLPIYFAVWFAVGVLWCIRWDRSLWRRPGLLTSVVGGIIMLLLTQAPSLAGPLRNQIRELSGVQFFFAVGVCALACAGRWIVSRARVIGIFVTLAAMGWVSWARDPSGPVAIVGIVVVMVAAALLIMVAVHRDRLIGWTAVVTTFALTLLAFVLLESGRTTIPPDPDTVTAGTLGLTRADEPIFAIYGPGLQKLWNNAQADGVGHAFSDLRAGARISPGYSSIGQAAFSQQLCTVSLGIGCPTEATRLFLKEPTTGIPWVDLLGYRTVVVARASRKLFRATAPPEWHLVENGAEFTEYRRPGPLAVAGRVTHVIGEATVTSVSLSNEEQTYRVASQGGARLIFRDLYWPGYVATLNGRSIPVEALDRTLVTVQLPPGTVGTLRVSYVPISRSDLLALPGTSVLLLGGVCWWTYRRRRSEPEAVA